MAQFLKISLFLVLVGLLHNSSAKIDEGERALLKKALKKFGKLPGFIGQAMEIYEMFDGLYNIFTSQGDESLDTDQRLDMLNNKMDKLSNELSNFEARLNDKLEGMDKASTLQRLLRTLYNEIRKIDNKYEDFKNFFKEPKAMEDREQEIINFANNVVNTDNQGVNTILREIHNALVSAVGKEKSILAYLNDLTIAEEFMCAMEQSPQQIIYNLFDTIVLSEVKGYAMLKYSYDVLDAIAGSTNIKKFMITDFQNRTKTTLNAVRGAMKFTSRVIRKCDPANPIQDENYEKFGPVFQAYVMYESDARTLKKNKSYSCDGTCGDISHAKHYCKDDRNCRKDQCSGFLRNCQHKHTHVEYCLSNDPYRRYEYFKYGKDTYGEKNNCESDIIEGDATNFYLINRCDYCLCTCEDTSNTMAKYVSLRPVFSDIEDNKVIVGASIVLKKNVFHIKIQQGVLLPSGRIKKDTITWKKVDRFTVLDQGVQKNKDYYEISWDENTVAIDDVDFSSNRYQRSHVLTGLQFQNIDSTLQLSTYLSPFDFKTGKVNSEHENRILNIKGAKSGSPMTLDKRDVPTNCRRNDREANVMNNYVQFSTSDLEKDAAQNLLPFVDIQKVESKIPVPLSGAGIFLRSDDKGQCGGYLALKLFTYNFRPQMKLNMAVMHDMDDKEEY